MEFMEENKIFRCPAGEVGDSSIACKNYRIQISEGSGSDIGIRYRNNRFRKMPVARSGSTVYLEEKMAVTFYGLFRFIELMKDNLLEVQIPHGCEQLNISVETGVTQSSVYGVYGICAKTISLISSTGQIQTRNVDIAEKLSVDSPAGRIVCQLPGTVSNYDVDCRIDRKDVAPPFYPRNDHAAKKVFLRSNMYIPKLTFLQGGLLNQSSCSQELPPL